MFLSSFFKLIIYTAFFSPFIYKFHMFSCLQHQPFFVHRPLKEESLNLYIFHNFSVFLFFTVYIFHNLIFLTIFLFLTIYLFFTSSYFSQSSNFSVAKFQLHSFPVFRSPLSIIFPAFPCTIFSVMFYCLTHNLIVNLFSNIKTLPFHTFKLLAVGSFVIQ